MRRLAGCMVVSLLASAAGWVGCRDDLGDEAQGLIGSGTDDGGIIIVTDTIVGSGSDVGEGGMPDAGSGSGTIDAGSGSGTIDAGSGSGTIDAGSGSGTIDAGSGTIDAGSDTIDAGSDSGSADDAGDPLDDGGLTGRPDARRGAELQQLDRTSFYACAGGPRSAGLELGLPIALALGVAVRRRRRWRRG